MVGGMECSRGVAKLSNRNAFRSLIGSILIFSSPAMAGDTAWTIGSRTLPPSAHASDALRKLQAEMPVPNPEARKGTTWTTPAELKAQVAKLDAARGAAVEAEAKRSGATLKADRIAGVPVYWVTPAKIAPEHANRLFIVLHGGAYVYGGGLASADEAVAIANRIGIQTLAVDYRMAPDHPAPAAMTDVVAVWREILKTHQPEAVILGGTSSGGNLTLVSTLKLKSLKLPLPGALYIGTPVADLAKRGDSRFLNDGVDHVVVTWDGGSVKNASLYVGKKSYEDPYISPVFGDFAGFPPTYLISGTRDILMSDTILVHRKLKEAGVEAELNIYEGLAHADYFIYPDLPESQSHYKELGQFISKHIKR